MIDKFLNFLVIRTRFKRDSQLYWLNTVSTVEISRMINYYEQINKPRKKYSSKNSSGTKKLYQKTLDAHTIQALAHRDARKVVKEIERKDLKEEKKQPVLDDMPELTIEENKMLRDIHPDDIPFFKKRFGEIKQSYYIDKKTMSDKEAIELFQQSTNKLLHSLIKDQEQNM